MTKALRILLAAIVGIIAIGAGALWLVKIEKDRREHTSPVAHMTDELYESLPLCSAEASDTAYCRGSYGCMLWRNGAVCRVKDGAPKQLTTNGQRICLIDINGPNAVVETSAGCDGTSYDFHGHLVEFGKPLEGRLTITIPREVKP